MCGDIAERYDFIGIYPCDAPTMIADQEWSDKVATWNGGVPGFEAGDYVPGNEYVFQNYLWIGYTCGSLDTECQSNQMEWPTAGTVVIDPALAGQYPWAFPGGATLAPGCYKAILNREVTISPPPYPTICADWADAYEFTVA